MQPLQWYGRRLRSMSPGEICWRVGNKLSECVDRCAAPVRRQHVSRARIARDGLAGLGAASDVLGAHWPAPGDVRACPPEWVERVVRRAELIRANRLDLFDLAGCDLGSAINWNYEYKAGKAAPTCFSADVDYRDYASTGDCKFVWEPNRHQHLVVLGRAYRLTGEQRYARTVVEHLDSWMEQCPFGTGMNWRSPLELGIRLINWVWALELIRPADMLKPTFCERLLSSVYRHLWEISRKYSRYSSANNHLIGEAAGVFIGSSYFSGLKSAGRWQQESRAILLREVLKQTYPDGGTREQAVGYHLFVLEFFLLAGIVARNAGMDFPAEYWERVERMLGFVEALGEGGDELPMFGDADDGYVLDLGSRASAPDLLDVGGLLLNRPRFLASTEHPSETSFWLMGANGTKTADAVPGSERISSRALPDSGYYLLQYGTRGAADRISVTFDCGELGFGSIAAHGHADALSITLRAFGRDVLVDPGTYDYFTYPRWREYFRSTPAHNTVTVDDEDQSEMLGPFLWGHRAQARCLRWEPTDRGGTVAGEHDGYLRLPNPVRHRRTVTLDGPRGELVIRDELAGDGEHRAGLAFHLAEACAVASVHGTQVHVTCPGGSVILQLDSRLKVDVTRGCENPPSGWVSRGYHRRQPTSTVIARCEWSGSADLVTRIQIG